MTKQLTAGKPFKVTYALNGQVKTTSHTTRRHAEKKIGQVMAAGAETARIQYYEAGTVVTVEAIGGELGWSGLESIHDPFEGMWK